MGCFEPRSTAAANSSASFASAPASELVRTTANFPSVRVPVLSKTTFWIFASLRRESGFRITTDLRAPIAVATTRLIGTAIPKAQGQAITKTATAASKALNSFPVEINQMANVLSAITITEGTKNREMLSARDASFVFCAVASRTKSAI